MYILIVLIALIVLAAGWFCAPLCKRSPRALPLLLIGKIGTAPKNTKDKKCWTSAKRLERFFALLRKRNITCLLPHQLGTAALPPSSLMLIFAGGYQSFYDTVFPLLEKYDLKAAVVLPAALVGQYDSWQAPHMGPWQNILSKEQVKELNKSARVEFISTTLEGTPLNSNSDERAVWQILENKQRLQDLYGIKTDSVFFPQELLPRPAVLQEAQKHFSCLISPQPGLNQLPLYKADTLKTIAFHKLHFFCRLFWQIK